LLKLIKKAAQAESQLDVAGKLYRRAGNAKTEMPAINFNCPAEKR